MPEREAAWIIRAAQTLDDRAVVRELFQEYAAIVDAPACFRKLADELAALPGCYAPPAGGLFLAFDGPRPAGCAALRSLDAERCEIKRLYVRSAYRGRGLGRALTVHMLAAADKAGYRRAYLDTLPSMTAAIGLYRTLGFTETPPYSEQPTPGALFFARKVR